jgi:hypothetical protein
MVVERREAQRARSRRFAQADLLWRAPRPKRGRVATSVRVAWPTTRRLPALHSERAWLFVRVAFCELGFGKTRTQPASRERGSLSRGRASFEARGACHRAGHFGPDPLARTSG